MTPIVSVGVGVAPVGRGDDGVPPVDDALEEPGEVPGVAGVGAVAEGLDPVLGGDGVPVAPDEVGVEVEGPGQAVVADAPLQGRAGDDVEVLVDPDEGVAPQIGRVAGPLVDRLVEVEDGGEGRVGRDDEDLLLGRGGLGGGLNPTEEVAGAVSGRGREGAADLEAGKPGAERGRALEQRSSVDRGPETGDALDGSVGRVMGTSVGRRGAVVSRRRRRRPAVGRGLRAAVCSN
jgi:hypothetical protein